MDLDQTWAPLCQNRNLSHCPILNRLPDQNLYHCHFRTALGIGERQRRYISQTTTTEIHHTHRKLCAKIAAEVALRNHDTCFDFNLRLGLVQDRDELTNRVDVFFNVRDESACYCDRRLQSNHVAKVCAR
jgi:hypothetical protein